MLWKPDKSARGPNTHLEEPIRERLTTTFFTYCIFLHSWPMAASSIMSLLKLWLNSSFFWAVFWTVVAVQRPSRRVHRIWDCFSPLNGTEHEFQPSLTTRDRELVSVLEVGIEPGSFEPETSDSAVCHSTNYTTRWVMKKYVQLFFEQAMVSYLKKLNT